MAPSDTEKFSKASLRKSAIKFRTLFESANDGIMIFDGPVVVDCNKRVLEMFGQPRDEIVGHSPEDRSPAMQADGISSEDKSRDKLAAAMQGKPQSFEWIHRRSDGTYFDVQVSLYRIETKPPRHVIAILRDITDQKQFLSALQASNDELKASNEELASLYHQLAASDEAIRTQINELKISENSRIFSEERYRLARDASNDAIWEVDIATDELIMSAHWLTRFGIPSDTLFERKRWLERIHPDDLRLVTEAIDAYLKNDSPYYDIEYRARESEGNYVWLHVRGKALFDEHGIPLRFAGSLTDITERKEREDQVHHLAYYDALTGLPNRSRLEQLLVNLPTPGGKPGALLFIDLDDFKMVNDSVGHICGDDLLADVAKYLSTAVGPPHILARVGGDEFIVVLEGISKRAFIDAYAQNLMGLFHSPFVCQGHPFYLSASIGIALFPEDGRTLVDLLQKADIALHHAKETGRASYCFFEQSMQDSLRDKISLQNRLRNAMLTYHDFSMHYQPQVDVKTGRIIGLEALMRWNCAESGMISPVQFIPLAEESGLIVALGDWGLRTACRFCRSLHDAGHSDMYISVNISVRQLLQDHFVETIVSALVETGLPPSALELEITESILIQDFESNVRKLSELRNMGIRTALDDFGTGYSSLTYLQQLPLHTLKIDKSFVNRITTEKSTRIIIGAIISLAHELGIVIVAEGIETASQQELLTHYDCDVIQGYLISRPLPEEQIRKWLQNFAR